MTLMAMTMWIMTMATHVTKHRMMIQSTRNHRLLRKSVKNQILQELLPLMCLHWHQEHLHWHRTRHLQHCSALAKLNTARTRHVLPWEIYHTSPNATIECLCAPEMCMVSTDTPLSNSGILKVPLIGDKLLVRPPDPHKRTHWTISLVVSLTPLQCPLRKMCKRCARKGEQT